MRPPSASKKRMSLAVRLPLEIVFGGIHLSITPPEQPPRLKLSSRGNRSSSRRFAVEIARLSFVTLLLG